MCPSSPNSTTNSTSLKNLLRDVERIIGTIEKNPAEADTSYDSDSLSMNSSLVCEDILTADTVSPIYSPRFTLPGIRSFQPYRPPPPLIRGTLLTANTTDFTVHRPVPPKLPPFDCTPFFQPSTTQTISSAAVSGAASVGDQARPLVPAAPLVLPAPAPAPVVPAARVVNLYDGAGNIEKFKKRKLTQKQEQEKKQREAADPTSSRGARCDEYLTDAALRTNSRRNNLNGLRKKMRDLKTTTNDETLLVHFKDFGTPKCQETKWATSLKLLNIAEPEEEVDECPPPPAPILTALSPSRTRNTTRKWVCSVCGISYGTKPDKAWNGETLDDAWIGCSYPLGEKPTCQVWNHKRCLGIIMPKNLKSFHWLCENHREKPKGVKRKLVARR